LTDSVLTDYSDRCIPTEIHINRCAITLYIHIHWGGDNFMSNGVRFCTEYKNHGFRLQLWLELRLGLRFGSKLEFFTIIHTQVSIQIGSKFDGGGCNYKTCRLAIQ